MPSGEHAPDLDLGRMFDAEDGRHAIDVRIILLHSVDVRTRKGWIGAIMSTDCSAHESHEMLFTESL